jgi:hypothetical protein
MRRQIYRDAAERGWMLFFEHDIHPKISPLVEIDGKFVIDEARAHRFEKNR